MGVEALQGILTVLAAVRNMNGSWIRTMMKVLAPMACVNMAMVPAR
jgi:hypothetical protein